MSRFVERFYREDLDFPVVNAGFGDLFVSILHFTRRGHYYLFFKYNNQLISIYSLNVIPNHDTGEFAMNLLSGLDLSFDFGSELFKLVCYVFESIYKA